VRQLEQTAESLMHATQRTDFRAIPKGSPIPEFTIPSLTLTLSPAVADLGLCSRLTALWRYINFVLLNFVKAGNCDPVPNYIGISRMEKEYLRTDSGVRSKGARPLYSEG